MKKYSLDDLKIVYNNNGVVGKKISNNHKFEIVQLSLKPQAHLAKHKTPFLVQFYAKKSNVILEIADSKIELNENEIIDCDANVSHGILNNSDSESEVLVIKHKYTEVKK